MKVKNWDKFQHYKPKNPKYQKKMTWFKLYGADLLNSMEWHELSYEEKATLLEIWCLASETQGILPEPKEIAFRLRKETKVMVKILDKLKDWIDYSDNGIDEVYTNSILEKSIEEQSIVITATPTLIKSKGTANDFDKWWLALPDNRKVNKKGCIEKWKAKKLDKVSKDIMKWTSMMVKTKQWKEGFNPAPETILNQERWNDTGKVQSLIPKGVV
jgi:DNA-binding MarR family transcriptional regulator|tara:strand:- start:3784 stop:4428 length:645 start_codon:yes stop_codon:yes gene_type:complete